MNALYPILSRPCGVLQGVRALLLTAALALVLAPAAQADVVMDPLKPCYVSDGDLPTQRETIRVHATGFTPLSQLTLSLESDAVASGQADAFGVATAAVPAPFEGRSQHQFTLSVVENENPYNLASATALVTNLRVTMQPRRARPSRRVRISGRGFTNAAPVYGHYLYRGKVRRTVRFARQSTGPCGTFRTRRRQIPLKRPGTGDWVLQVDQQRRYAALPASNAQRVIIRVTETFKEP